MINKINFYNEQKAKRLEGILSIFANYKPTTIKKISKKKWHDILAMRQFYYSKIVNECKHSVISQDFAKNEEKIIAELNAIKENEVEAKIDYVSDSYFDGAALFINNKKMPLIIDVIGGCWSILVHAHLFMADCDLNTVLDYLEEKTGKKIIGRNLYSKWLSYPVPDSLLNDKSSFISIEAEMEKNLCDWYEKNIL